MHSQKLMAIEQANRLLEQELETLKEQQKSERAKVKEKMDTLNSKQNEKIKRLEETNKTLEAELAKIRLNSDSIIGTLKQQFDDYKKRISELESYEKVRSKKSIILVFIIILFKIKSLFKISTFTRS